MHSSKSGREIAWTIIGGNEALLYWPLITVLELKLSLPLDPTLQLLAADGCCLDQVDTSPLLITIWLHTRPLATTTLPTSLPQCKAGAPETVPQCCRSFQFLATWGNERQEGSCQQKHQSVEVSCRTSKHVKNKIRLKHASSVQETEGRSVMQNKNVFIALWNVAQNARECWLINTKENDDAFQLWASSEEHGKH